MEHIYGTHSLHVQFVRDFTLRYDFKLVPNAPFRIESQLLFPSQFSFHQIILSKPYRKQKINDNRSPSPLTSVLLRVFKFFCNGIKSRKELFEGRIMYVDTYIQTETHTQWDNVYTHSLTLTHTHTLYLSLSLTHTHKHRNNLWPTWVRTTMKRYHSQKHRTVLVPPLPRVTTRFIHVREQHLPREHT